MNTAVQQEDTQRKLHPSFAKPLSLAGLPFPSAYGTDLGLFSFSPLETGPQSSFPSFSWGGVSRYCSNNFQQRIRNLLHNDEVERRGPHGCTTIISMGRSNTVYVLDEQFQDLSASIRRCRRLTRNDIYSTMHISPLYSAFRRSLRNLGTFSRVFNCSIGVVRHSPNFEFTTASVV